MQKLGSSLLQSKLMRYTFFGGLAYLVDVTSFIVLYKLLSAPLIIATSVSFILGLLSSFITNKLFVFEATKETAHHTTLRQSILYVLLVLFNMVFTYLLVRALLSANFPAVVAKTAATGCITLWNFVIYKKVIFKKRAQ